MSAQYHTKYYAYELTKKRSSHQLEKLSKSIFNTTVDLNPYQLYAALLHFDLHYPEEQFLPMKLDWEKPIKYSCREIERYKYGLKD